MKFAIKLRSKSKTSEHKLELGLAGTNNENSGRVDFRIDDSAKLESADWAEVTPGVYSIILSGKSHEPRIATPAGAASTRELAVSVGVRDYIVEVQDPRERRHSGGVSAHDGPQEIVAPMPGRIVKVLVKENQTVGAGDGLVVIEAMKMQNELRASRPGRVEKVYVVEGTGVETGFKLLRLV